MLFSRSSRRVSVLPDPGRRNVDPDVMLCYGDAEDVDILFHNLWIYPFDILEKDMIESSIA